MDQGTTHAIATHYLAQAESRFAGYPVQHEAMADAETMALDFLTQNSGLSRGHNLDPPTIGRSDRRADAIGTR
jgi:hypothetical protein